MHSTLTTTHNGDPQVLVSFCSKRFIASEPDILPSGHSVMPALVKRVLCEAGVMLVAVQLPVQVRDIESWMPKCKKKISHNAVTLKCML